MVLGMENIKQLGERIRAERVAQGYSVQSAAKKSGIARDTWRKIEAGGSVHDTKRHVAMEFLGISEANVEWGTVGGVEDHAADPSEMMDLNLMFSQAVRFAATIGILVPEVRDDAERMMVELSALFTRGIELWDRGDPWEKYDNNDVVLQIDTQGGGEDDASRRNSTSGEPALTPADEPEEPLSEEAHSLRAVADNSKLEGSGEDHTP